MKKIALSILMVAAVSVSGIGAATAAPPRPSQPTESRTPETQEHQGSLPVSTVLGLRVTDPSGQEVGTIVDLLIDEESGRITHAVVSMGDLLTLVSWNDLVKGNGDRQPMEHWQQRGVSLPKAESSQKSLPSSFVGNGALDERR